MTILGNHAIVLGSGLAGLLAGRALADAFEQVTLLERDPSRTDTEPRRGVPQGRHAHALLGRGLDELERLFPDIADELVAAGAVVASPGRDQRFVLGGHTIRRVDAGTATLQATRPLLELHIRRRLLALDNVALLSDRDVVDLVAADNPARCAGVRTIARTPGSAAETIRADLVVDALGRSSRLTRWLADGWGCDVPVDELNVDVAYATRPYRLHFAPDGGDKAVVVGPVPDRPSGMALLAVENGRYLVTVAGIARHRPPTDDAGFLRFVCDIAPPDVALAIGAGEPAGPIATFRYPSVVRRRFGHTRRLPPGVLAIGDALCSFNPLYAQGMTVAALQAALLRDVLTPPLTTVPTRFFRRADRLLNAPWTMGRNADLALPEIDGARTLSTRLGIALSRRVNAAAAHDEVVARRLLRVISMLDAPTTLTRPAVLARLLRPHPKRSGEAMVPEAPMLLQPLARD
jgi:2-polyprenyl-6-methoxyphenol hydroxylase-like FAD-dependent oxidoreductase